MFYNVTSWRLNAMQTVLEEFSQNLNQIYCEMGSFMLFETTGDSEVNCDPTMNEFGCEFVKWADYVHDDDAESCSYDICDFNNGCDSGDVDDECDGEKNEEKDDVSHDQTWYADRDDVHPEHHETSVSVDSIPEEVNEMEKNRRFWEACLAS
ncbi:WD repeat-containing protein 55-like [Quillaja saponaria]|uniref:WD repeat-containing protein 55-like n=1 Tax=Quillaja saponaria TaxID=32244 RepID=A0AAD7Q1F1_QUISA|nr:WD repeat-containing protein 55-like [Quillaja saponaria]